MTIRLRALSMTPTLSRATLAKRLVPLLVGMMVSLSLLQSSHAGTVNISATGDGWCYTAGGCNNTDVHVFSNTFAGSIGSTYYNDWFAVDIPVVNTIIVAATINVWSDRNNATSSGAIYYLTKSLGFTYDLLTSGTLLGTISLDYADTGVDHYVTIPLNGNGLSLLYNAQGTNFVFGGGPSPNGALFGYTNGTPAPYLTLITADIAAVPEPVSFVLLAGAGIVAAATRSRVRRGGTT